MPPQVKRRLSADEAARGVDLSRRALNQYFTPDDVALRCAEAVRDALGPALFATCVFVEPGAGGGAFVRALQALGVPDAQIVPVELDPDLCAQHPGYVHADFLRCDRAALHIAVPPAQTVVIGNPPFTRTGSWTRGGTHSAPLAFVNHAATLAHTVALVLGVGFRRDSTIDRVHPALHLRSETDLRESRFLDCATGRAKRLKTATVFQVWRRAGVELRDADAPGEDRLRTHVERPRRRTAQQRVAGGRWAWPDGRPGEFRFLKRGEAGGNLALRRWRHLGVVAEAPADLARVDPCLRDTKNRATGTYFWIAAADVPYVASVFRALAPRFKMLEDALGGNTCISCSLNMAEVVRLYQEHHAGAQDARFAHADLSAYAPPRPAATA